MNVFNSLALIALVAFQVAGAEEAPCRGDQVVVHAFGGGLVSTTAQVSPEAYISADSAVCGRSIVNGPVRLENKSRVEYEAVVSGSSIISGSIIIDRAQVSNSTVASSRVSESTKVVDSVIQNSAILEHASVHYSEVYEATISGDNAVFSKVLRGQMQELRPSSLLYPDYTKETCASSNSRRSYACPEFVNECAKVAYFKLEGKAKGGGAFLVPGTMKVSDIDENLIAKYVWFKGVAQKADGSQFEVSVLTQKPIFQGCF